MSIGVIVAIIFAILAIAICTVAGITSFANGEPMTAISMFALVIVNVAVLIFDVRTLKDELAESKEEQTEQIVTVGEMRARTVQIDTVITYSSLTGACDTTYIIDTTTCK